MTIGPFAVAVLKMTFVLLAALGMTRFLRRASAGARHLVWLVALCALLTLPPLAAWSPLELAVLPTSSPVVTAPPAAVSPLEIEASRVASPRTAAASTEATPSVLMVDAATPSLGTMLFWAWAAVTFALLARLMYGAWLVQRIIRRAESLDHPSWQTPLYEIADRLGLEEAPRLLRSEDVKMPFAAGLRTSVIVLPAESDEWTAERRSAVLIHELGHVRRRDLLGHTLGRVACALYWFHPLVWSAARQLRAESERACDDLALLFGTRASDYAEHLLEIVSGVRDHRMPAVALAMAHRNEFEGRMLAILNPDLRRLAPSRLESAAVVGAVALLAVLVGAAAPVPRSAAPSAAVAAVPIPDPVLEDVPVTVTPAAPVSDRRMPTSKPTTKEKAAPPSTKEQREPLPARVAAVLEAASADSGLERATVLAKLLRTDPSAEVRRVAAWGLERYPGVAVAVDALIAALDSDRDAQVREMSAWALAGAGRSAAATAALGKALKQERDASVRTTLVWAAGQRRACDDVEPILAALRGPDAETRELAAWAIGSCSPERAPAALVQALGDKEAEVRLSVAWALFRIRDASTAGAIDAAFRRETDAEVQEGLIHALGTFGELSVDVLQRLVTSPDSTVRRFAVTTLARSDGLGPWPWPRPEPRPYPER